MPEVHTLGVQFTIEDVSPARIKLTVRDKLTSKKITDQMTVNQALELAHRLLNAAEQALENDARTARHFAQSLLDKQVEQRKLASHQSLRDLHYEEAYAILLNGGRLTEHGRDHSMSVRDRRGAIVGRVKKFILDVGMFVFWQRETLHETWPREYVIPTRRFECEGVRKVLDFLHEEGAELRIYRAGEEDVAAMVHNKHGMVQAAVALTDLDRVILNMEALKLTQFADHDVLIYGKPLPF